AIVRYVLPNSFRQSVKIILDAFDIYLTIRLDKVLKRRQAVTCPIKLKRRNITRQLLELVLDIKQVTLDKVARYRTHSLPTSLMRLSSEVVALSSFVLQVQLP